jgi:glutamyl-tRNA reductase
VSVVVVGLNHRHATLDQLERLSVSREQVPKALLSLTQRSHVDEAVVLSTCNRVEVYARVHRFHGGIFDLREFLCEWGGFAPEELAGLTYEYHDERAVNHLFAVTCGLDSVVVGEQQVARQVKQAYLDAEREGACGAALSGVFQRALRVARRVRTLTTLDNTASSMLDAGLEAARTHLGPLDGRTVLLVGAGKVGTLAARRLAASAGRVLAVNRTLERAERLAAHGATALPMEQLERGLEAADLVITSTASRDPVIDTTLLEPVVARRAGRPLLLVDLAVPRDVAAGCRQLPGVRVLDVDAVATTVASRPVRAELEQARALVAEEVAAFAAWQQARRVEPTIAALRSRAEQVRVAELERLSAKLVDLDERQLAAVEQLSRGIINTLLHEPTVRLKAASADDRGRWQAEVLRELFSLDDSVRGYASGGASAEPRPRKS